jgi:hypothetical protein
MIYEFNEYCMTSGYALKIWVCRPEDGAASVETWQTAAWCTWTFYLNTQLYADLQYESWSSQSCNFRILCQDQTPMWKAVSVSYGPHISRFVCIFIACIITQMSDVCYRADFVKRNNDLTHPVAIRSRLRYPLRSTMLPLSLLKAV